MGVPIGVGDVLAESGELTVRRLGRASTWQRANGGTIERALLSTGAVSEDVLTTALSQAYGLPGVARERLLESDPDVVDALPARDRRRLRAVPFHTTGKRLHIAVSDPRSPVLLNVLSSVTGFDVDLHVVPDPILEDVVSYYEKTREERQSSPPPRAATPAVAVASPGEDSIERLGRALLAEALRFDAVEMVLGIDARGAFVRTFEESRPALTRRLSEALIAPLSSWFQRRCQREGGFIVESADGDTSQRRRVELMTADPKGVSVRLVPVEENVKSGFDVGTCRHERAEGFVFCPHCGAVL